MSSDQTRPPGPPSNGEASHSRGAAVEAMRNSTTIATLRGVSRIWAIGAIHGDAQRLARLHEAMWPRLRDRDALVYLGNYLGRGGAVVETVDELLSFRRRALGRPRLHLADDVVFLRGSQEEMWQKLLQLQFASDPIGILNWVLQRGADATLASYGGSADDVRRAAIGGTRALNEWTRRMREAVRRHPGHETFMAILKRAAMTAEGSLLFVNCGVDPDRPLAAQSDAFWWAGGSFDAVRQPFEGFRRVVRGYDPSHRGLAETDFTLTADGGCGFGGSLIAFCLAPGGAVLDRLEA